MFSSRLQFDNTVCVKVTQKLSLLAITETRSIIASLISLERITNTRDFSINMRHSSLLMLSQHASAINTVSNSLLPFLSLRYFYSLKWQMLLRTADILITTVIDIKDDTDEGVKALLRKSIIYKTLTIFARH